MDKIIIKGAKTHNLKNVDLTLPRNSLIVMTGLSGSGKSSLAFDTIYAEGQRRYVESLSTYARQFLQQTEKPDVESIEGLSPAISIDQKTAPRNPRSTVGTVTEIYDFLRLLFARVGHPHCPNCGQKIQRQSVSQIMDHIELLPEGKKLLILAPIIRDKKGEHNLVIDKIKKDGFVRLRLDGTVITIAEDIEMDAKKKHTIEIVIDRVALKNVKRTYETLSTGEKIETPNPERTRLYDSIELALKYGNGLMILHDVETEEDTLFSEQFACPNCGVNLPEIEPRSFSFNSPHGACETCHGLGTKLVIDAVTLIPNEDLSVDEGAIQAWALHSSQLDWFTKILKEVGKKYGFATNIPYSKLTENARKIILYGTGDERYGIKYGSETFSTRYEGVIPYLERKSVETESDSGRKRVERFMKILPCPDCGGKRLRKEVLSVLITDKSIMDLTGLSVVDLKEFIDTMQLSPNEMIIAGVILKEVRDRLQFLLNVGLSYLSLDRAANTLSGGEAQRIRLATQIGSKLTGVLYVLDEPSIGLHQKDNERLITTLNELRDLGNTVIVVEHDEDTMNQADVLVDIGPRAGKHGGEIIAVGTPDEIKKHKTSITGMYLSGRKKIEVPAQRRKGTGKFLEIIGAKEHNLQNIDVTIPLGTFTCITGVSGSGKSTLLHDILINYLLNELNGANLSVGSHKEIKGVEHLDKIIDIDQSPIGRTPRSNPATYTNVFTDIRELFARTNEAKVRGYKAGRFSFNVKGGRCESCQGDGMTKIEMHFLPDIYVTCETCKGRRYNNEALEITYRGKNIADVLEMTVEEARDFFDAIPSVKHKMEVLTDVGLGYIHLGQSATTLSGGEAQRIKLGTELIRKATGKTLYILDEPTTGLHFDDVNKLLEVLQRLVDKGNSLVVIEHNLDVIKSADWVIDLGPEGGVGGGEIIAKGTPEEVAKVKKSYTGQWLKNML